MKLFCAVLLLAAMCRAASYQSELSELPELPDGQSWELIWHDEFQGREMDPDKWEIIGDVARKGGFWTRANTRMDGRGHLELTVDKKNREFHCGAVRTMKKFEEKYGFFICRAKLPEDAGKGYHAAFWLMSRSVDQVGNEGRDGTEIDIFEKFQNDNSIQQALHWDGYGSAHKFVTHKTDCPGIRDGFHTFAVWWTPDEYIFYIDGEETWRTNAGGVSQVPAYIKLTTEVEEDPFNGNIRTAPLNLPDHFLIDYVRVYHIKGEGHQK